MAPPCHTWLRSLVCLLLLGCNAEHLLDDELITIIDQRQLTGNPAEPKGLSQVRPEDDALVRLGQLLFFSQTLSGNLDSACGTCHHPDFAATDGLSISVGVAPKRRSVVGPGRMVDPALDRDPLADGGPNMHRNSLTMFNAALQSRGLLMDGRIFVTDDATLSGVHGQPIRTPETGQVPEADERFGLLETLAPFPFTNDNEMRGFTFPELATPADYREHLVARLRNTSFAQYIQPDASDRWLALFREGFGEANAAAKDIITLPHIQQALAAYVRSQIFIEAPWKRYVEGERVAISAAAKQGALLFFKDPAQGGLGCAHCHSGDLFTDERFHNVGFPQIGRGFRRSDRRDVGRWFVTRESEQWFAFRTPGLLNVALTAPYGHAGTFATLEEVIAYHADPRSGVETFDFTLTHLEQFSDGTMFYEHAEPHTREVIQHPSFARAESHLPKRALRTGEIEALTAFLRSLTDDCAADPECRSAWTPDASLDPDGHMLVRDNENGDLADGTPLPDLYPESVSLTFPRLEARETFADVLGCETGLATAANTGQSRFRDRTGDTDFGLLARHGFEWDTWRIRDHISDLEAVMIAGGVTAAYMDADCWPDLILAGGDASGLVLYLNRGHQQGYTPRDTWLASALGTRFTGTAVADLNADYRRELVVGNLLAGEVPILALNGDGAYARVGGLPMSRHTFGISFGQFERNGYPGMYLGHWSTGGIEGSAPALWLNEGLRLRPYDAEAQTSPAYVDQFFNFTPAFADFTGNGDQDLLISSDFNTSQALQNLGDGRFTNATERAVFNDENGMGNAVSDFDNDGKLDWFVTSVFETHSPTGEVPGSYSRGWGTSGNRLYRNVSSHDQLRFEDVTEEAGVAEGYWGWGACAFDFDHDGFVDIFHVNGFGSMPEDVLPLVGRTFRENYDALTKEPFQDKPPRLFINQGDGTFTEAAEAWAIAVPSDGRGIACFDFDRDGDIDIAVLDHSKGIQFFENQVGHGEGRHFLNVRIVGAPPNTDALGARVTLLADVGRGYGEQTLLRVSAANSNFSSQNLPDLHFGLGEADTVARLEVRWPGDTESLECHDVAVNRFLVFDQRDKRCP